MKITFTRSGGFTGIPITKTVDTNSLDPEKAKEIEKLLRDSQFFSLHDLSTNNAKPNFAKANIGKPDRFTYTLSVQNGAIDHTVKIPESSMNEGIRKLIEYLQRL